MEIPKKLIVFLLAGVMICLGGCDKRLDAQAYTQAVLDVFYKNETEDYIKLTGASSEEAELIFQRNLDATMEEFKEMKLSQEMEEHYKALFEDIITQVKYSVGESTRLKDGSFTVEVNVEPVLLFDDTYDEFQEEAKQYTQGITNEVMEGGEIPSDKEVKEQVYQIYYNVLKAALDSGLCYGEPETLTVHVNKMENNTYKIPEEDIRLLDTKLISQEKLSRE